MSRWSWLPWLALLVSVCSALFLVSKLRNSSSDDAEKKRLEAIQNKLASRGNSKSGSELVLAIEDLSGRIHTVTGAFLTLAVFQLGLGCLILHRGASKGARIPQSSSSTDGSALPMDKKLNEERARLESDLSEIQKKLGESASELAGLKQTLSECQAKNKQLIQENQDLREQLAKARTPRAPAPREKQHRLIVVFDKLEANTPTANRALTERPDGYFELERTENTSFLVLKPAIDSLTTEHEYIFKFAFDFQGAGRSSFRVLQPAVVRKTEVGYELLRKGFLLPV